MKFDHSCEQDKARKTPPPQGRQRKSALGLKFSGAVLAITGALCAISLPLMVDLNKSLAPQIGLAPQDFRGILDQLLLNAVLAVWLIVLGVGVLRERRWACELALSTAFLWLGMGVLETLQFASNLPRYVENVIAATGDTKANPDAVAGVAFITMATIHLLVPGTIVWVLSDASLRDRIAEKEPLSLPAPLPLVVLALFLFLSALRIPPALAFGGSLPVFDRVLGGFPGVALCIGLTLSLIFAGIGLLQFRIEAWHVAVGLLGVMAFSTSISAERLPEETYAAARGILWPVDAYGKPQFVEPLHSRWSAAGLIVAFAYALFIRRLFDPPMEHISEEEN